MSAAENRIDRAFARLRERGEKALIPYVMLGDPDLETTETLALAASAAGADLLEIGIPFSDPLADGPVLQRAAERALQRKVTLADGVSLTRRLRTEIQTPLIFMTYYNLICQYGDERFAHDAAAAGVDGLIVPDLPPEEAGLLETAARAEGLHLIYLIAPTTPPARIKLIAERASGFLYYVSLTGITGSKLPALDEVEQGVARIKRVTDVPVAVGFGVSTPEEAARISRRADGVIVASALIKRLEAQPDMRHRVNDLMTFVGSLKSALGSGGMHSTGGS